MAERAAELFDCELKILRMQWEPMRQPASVTPKGIITREVASRPAPPVRWNGTDAELLEYTIPVHAAGKLSRASGEQMTWTDTVKHIETVYGITVPDLHDRKTKILNRYNNTAFIDKMRRVLLEEAKKSINKPTNRSRH